MGFAENVRSELDFQDIQIKELASKTGISKNTLEKYLSGKKAQPGIENAIKIAQVLGVSVEYLANGKKPDSDEILIPLIPNEYKRIIEQYKSLNQFNRKTVEDVLCSLATRQ